MALESNFNDICVNHDFDNKYSPFGLHNHDVYSRTRISGLNESYFLIPVMNLQAKKPLETLLHVNHTFWTILPTMYCFAIARILTQKMHPNLTHSGVRFVIEFILIIVPVILSINVANNMVIYVVAVFTIFLLLVMLYNSCMVMAQKRYFELGRHPRVLTLMRATINILTAVCILAIDFNSFPRVFRKSRRYGAGLMDVGIGLFIFAMGSVSRRPCRAADLSKLCKMVTPILLLGLARTLVIEYIDYHQDENEYGKHLNAFFTLGLTKLIGSFLSGAATTDLQLVPIGLGILAAHESVLQLGVSDFVMDKRIERNDFLNANREGVCSLPGFIAIYLISMYIGQMLQTHVELSYNEFMRKIKTLAQISGALWTLVLLSIFSVGIARVTCNFGYATWILAIAVTLTTFYMFIFDLVLNTVWPVTDACTKKIQREVSQGEGEVLLKAPVEREDINCADFWLPSLVEAVNRNGLTFFVLANVLTGAVNIFLDPGNRSDLESVVVLCGYMLIATGFVYILFCSKIRIA